MEVNKNEEASVREATVEVEGPEREAAGGSEATDKSEARLAVDASEREPAVGPEGRVEVDASSDELKQVKKKKLNHGLLRLYKLLKQVTSNSLMHEMMLLLPFQCG